MHRIVDASFPMLNADAGLTPAKEAFVAKKIVVIGGGAAGIGAAGAARGTDRDAEITVYTEYEDAAYSPCGIPYVHGGEIPDFERLFLGTKQQYADAGIDIRYSTAVKAIDPRGRTSVSATARRCPTTRSWSRPAGTTASPRSPVPTWRASTS